MGSRRTSCSASGGFCGEGALSAVGAGEEVVAASEYRVLQQQVRELQRLLGKKTLENEILREALDLAPPKRLHWHCAKSMRTRKSVNERPWVHGAKTWAAFLRSPVHCPCGSLFSKRD